MEKITLYEHLRRSIVEHANKMIQEGKVGPNGLTPQNVLEHLDEYTLRLVISYANEASRCSQAISEHNNSWGIKAIEDYIRPLGEEGEKLFSKIMSMEGKQINIGEMIRQEYFQLCGVPGNFKLPTVQEMAMFEKNVDEQYAQIRSNPELRYNYDFYSKYLNDFYDLLKMQSISKGVNGSVFNTGSVSELDKIRNEKLQQLEQMIIERQQSSGVAR